MTTEITTFAPGARLIIRDEEWLVKSALPATRGGTAVRVMGLSELVKNHEAVFLTSLDRVAELKPEDAKLVEDDSPRYRRSRLYLESLLRRTPPTDSQIYLGHRGAFNDAPYQLEPAHLALDALRPRILIADGVGLGKTVEAGILLSELIKRGRGERILVVAVRSMLAQFQEEIWARFSIPLVRLDSVGLQRVRAKIPSNKNPFYYYNRVIISVDTLKNDAQYRHYLEQCHWDVIVIDECHNVANLGSQRNRLAMLLARTCDSLILTSATPHSGRPESFANLMNMLEPTAIADSSNYTADEIAGLFVRRFKKDIEDQVVGQFSERSTELLRIDATPAEEAFFYRLETAQFRALGRRSSWDALYRVGLLKGFLSSPDACLQTLNRRLRRIERRLARLRGEEDVLDADEEGWDIQSALQAPADDADKGQQLVAELEQDRQTLEELRQLTCTITPALFSKYQHLLKLLRDLGADASPDAPRVIIFSERIATLGFLLENLRAEFGADDEAIVQFHAGLPDVRQQEVVESFGKQDSPIRILLASDAASEGVNLHYYCHLMLHFDIPWSLITLEQRNGRIDRYGQHESPIIHYLLTVSQNASVRGDLRVLDKLIEKEQEAHKNIGDAATILGLYDAQREETHITQAVAEGQSTEEIFDEQAPEQDWLATLMAGMDAPDLDEIQDSRAASPTLYEDDLAFARAAFDELMHADDALQPPEYHPQRREFTFLAPEDLRRRCEFVPQEAVPAGWAFQLTTDRQRVMEAIAEARKREREWPQVHLFWELHPVMEWLTDKLLVRFGRHQAPLVITPHLTSTQTILLFQGVLSNLRSQPLVTEWFGVRLDGGQGAGRLLDLEQVLAQTGFEAGLANAQQKSALGAVLPDLLPAAVEVARQHMSERRLERGQVLTKQLGQDVRKLKKWYDATLRRIAEREQNARGAQAARLYHEKNELRALYQQRQKWLDDTFSAVPKPYLRIVLAFVGS